MIALLKLVPWWLYVAAFLLVFIAVQALEVHHYKAKEATYKVAVSTYETAQKTNLATIAAYQKANKAWSDTAAKQQTRAATAIKQDAEFTGLQTLQSTNAGKALQVIYVNSPSARAWSTVPVDLSVSSELRANAGSTH